MLEPISIPILMKAVEFLFDEASKILQERRERRKKELGSKQLEDKFDNRTTENTIATKDAALGTPIDSILWGSLEAEVKHLVSLLDVYTKNYYLAKEQYAKFGSAMVPPVIVHNLAEAEDGIVDTADRLRKTLSKVYGRDIVVPLR